ncbi:putative nucleotide-diphospho-sugar transferase, partial [Tanacetum coccineum]
KAGVIEEFVNDALDSLLDSDGMEDEIREEVDRVLTAIADDTATRLPEAPNGEETIYRDDLEATLAGASTENNTVIIAVANKAYTEGNKPMLDIFLDGLWLREGTHKLKDHILIVAIDQTAYDICKMKTDGVEFDGGEKLFMSDDFIKMMCQRTLLLGDVLKHGYNFIFTVSF